MKTKFKIPAKFYREAAAHITERLYDEVLYDCESQVKHEGCFEMYDDRQNLIYLDFTAYGNVYYNRNHDEELDDCEISSIWLETVNVETYDADGEEIANDFDESNFNFN